MKSIKEKQHLVNLAKALGQNADPNLIKEINSFNSIKKDAHESIKRSALKDLTEAFRQAKLENEVQQIIEYPLPPTLDEVLQTLNEEDNTNELVQSQTEETPIRESKTTNPEPTLAERAAKVISEAPKKDSFQQPDPDPVEKNFAEIQRKLKFLEATIGKIAVAGPGSGETKFRMLDDVDRSSIGNTDQVLRWRPDPRGDAYGKFFFGQLSGDQGPIRSMRYDTSGYGANANVLPGITAWNTDKDCLDIHQNDGSVLQVGLENYVRVYNPSNTTMNSGLFVSLNTLLGIDAETPACQPYQANAGSFPYFTLGIITTTIPPQGVGRATVLGEVHDVDTTGNTAYETWAVGDVLWASPSTPGGLTTLRPTAPNVAVTVGKVITVDSSDGLILVRPTVLPHFYYGTFISTQDQRAANINYPYAIRYDYTAETGPVSGQSGFHLSSNTRIVAENTGLYNYQFSLQLSSSSASTKNIWIWPRIDGQDVPNSATRISVSTNNGSLVAAWNFIFSMIPGRYFELMWAVDDLTLFLDNPPVTNFCPAIPSVILTVSQVNS